ncbi:unnamed protein product [Pleuronectes platessa]|uniref:Uncharacterized protein n=1 Tax=Pleuronectes platessa TaxID=8262 RepID=A0A9N7VB37_PLEPL|nr:unnamed protein product [Pleuronectes platessa]
MRAELCRERSAVSLSSRAPPAEGERGSGVQLFSHPGGRKPPSAAGNSVNLSSSYPNKHLFNTSPKKDGRLPPSVLGS